MNNSILKGLALAGTLIVNNMQGEICSKCGQAYGDTDINEVKGWCGKCCKFCGEHPEHLLYDQYCAKCAWKPSKDKWQITVDFIMIVGKYFKTPQDFINAMKVCKKYEELVLMYRFNPIVVDELLIELFHNIQTLHIYTPNCVLDIDAYRNRLIAERDNLRRMIAEENNLSTRIAQVQEARNRFPTQDILYQTLANEQAQLQQGLANIEMLKTRIQQIENLLSILPEGFFKIVLWPGCHLLPINHANIDCRPKEARIFFNDIEVLPDRNDAMYPLTMHIPSQKRKNITNAVGMTEPKILVQVPLINRNVKIYLDVCIEFIEPKAFYPLKNCCVLIIVPSYEKFEALKAQLLFAISTDNCDPDTYFSIEDLDGNLLW